VSGPDPVSPCAGIAVLLVDDDHDVLGANARFLRVSGLDVIVADSADAALARLVDEPIDVIVTDLRMPDGSGLAFARSARTVRPLVPILFFSGFARIPDVVAAMKLGAVDFLEKPVDPALLLDTLVELTKACGGAPVEREAFVAPPDGTSLRARVRAYEKHLIETALHRHDGSVADVLESLRINRRTLNDKMAKLGIRRQSVRGEES